MTPDSPPSESRILGHLIVVAGPDLGQAFPVMEGQTLVIGRGQATATRLQDVHVSREHCRLQALPGNKFLVTDAGSASGTQVNGKRGNRHELKSGDVIQIGTTQLRLCAETVHEDTTVVPPPSAGQPGSPPAEGQPHHRNLQVSCEQGVLVLTITRSHILDHEVADTLRQQLLAAVAEAGVRKVVLNLQHVHYISTAAFGPLLCLRQHLQREGGRLVLCSLSTPVAWVCRVAAQIGFDPGSAPLEMAADIPAAIARLNTTQEGK